MLPLSYVKGNQELSSELATGWMLKWGWLMAGIPDLKGTGQSQGEEELPQCLESGKITRGSWWAINTGGLGTPASSTPATLAAQLHAAHSPCGHMI